MRLIHKEYKQHFLVEPTKLDKLVDVIQGSLAEHRGRVLKSYEVVFKGDRSDTFDNIDDVYRLDNSKKGKIQRLLITMSSTPDGDSKPNHEAQVDFSVLRQEKKDRLVTTQVKIRSDSTSWASRTLADIEQQTDRTKQQYTLPLVAACLIFISIALLALSQLTVGNTSYQMSNMMWLSPPEVDKVGVMLKQNAVLTSENLREIQSWQMQNLLLDQHPAPSPGRELSRQQVAFGIPLVVVAIIAVLLALTCYPRGVFYWGDEIDAFDKIKSRRIAAWGLIMTIVIMSWATTLFGSAVINWLGHH